MNPYQMTSQALAYLGDSVLEVKVREYLVTHALTRSAALNRTALSFVTAKRQSEAVQVLLPLLTEEEADIFKRGKNSHVTPPKSASLNEYKRATGFECVLGYLYLNNDHARIDKLFRLAYAAELAALAEADTSDK